MIVIEICLGSSCYVKGANQVVESVKQCIKKNDWTNFVVLKGAFCMGNCSNGLGLRINNEIIHDCSLTNLVETIERAIRKSLT